MLFSLGRQFYRSILYYRLTLTILFINNLNVIQIICTQMSNYNNSIIIIIGGARSVIVIVVGNGHGDTSSNPGRD